MKCVEQNPKEYQELSVESHSSPSKRPLTMSQNCSYCVYHLLFHSIVIYKSTLSLLLESNASLFLLTYI